MKLLITGGTGFIGTPLCRALTQHGHELFVVTRRPQEQPAWSGVHFLSWEPLEWAQRLAMADGVINLAGEPLAAGRWNASRKRAIRESRIQSTRAVVDTIVGQTRKPAVLINASAIGYYGDRGNEVLHEHAAPGRGFLPELCSAWEAEAQRAEAFGVRVVRVRIGIVLGPDGGALSKMVPPFRLGIGGPLGSGRQWMSWIHRDDLIGLIEWALTQPTLSGPVNATAPYPLTMRHFARELGRALNRPSWAPVPSIALRVLLGEMADLLLTGQRVLPQAALNAGYQFTYPQLPEALHASLTPFR